MLRPLVPCGPLVCTNPREEEEPCVPPLPVPILMIYLTLPTSLPGNRFQAAFEDHFVGFTLKMKKLRARVVSCLAQGSPAVGSETLGSLRQAASGL